MNTKKGGGKYSYRKNDVCAEFDFIMLTKAIRHILWVMYRSRYWDGINEVVEYATSLKSGRIKTKNMKANFKCSKCGTEDHNNENNLFYVQLPSQCKDCRRAFKRAYDRERYKKLKERE